VYTAYSLNVAEYQIGHEEGCAPLWLAQQKLIYGADRVTALTRSEHELVAEYCPNVLGRVRIIGNGIDDYMEARIKARQDRSPMVFFAGRFVGRKGIYDLQHSADAPKSLAPLSQMLVTRDDC
jgi:glycosyltransferase involved in cell wall biosynthesis